MGSWDDDKFGTILRNHLTEHFKVIANIIGLRSHYPWDKIECINLQLKIYSIFIIKFRLS